MIGESKAAPVAHSARAYPSFSVAWSNLKYMYFYHPPWWDASLLQDYPPSIQFAVTLIVPKNTTQHNDPSQGSNPDHSIWLEKKMAHYLTFLQILALLKIKPGF